MVDADRPQRGCESNKGCNSIRNMKQITLPFGMVIGDVSGIGQYTHISGRTYGATNIKLSEVKTVLSSSSNSLKTLCLDSNISKWAAFKPWRVTNSTAANHGMIIGQTSDIEYQKPTDATGYHLGHFAGYNHNPPVPGVFTLIGGTIYFESSTTIDRSFQVTLPEFDVRTVHNSISKVIIRQVGESDRQAITLTDAIQTDQFVSGQVSLQTDISEAVQTVQLQMWLGFDLGGGLYEELCNYPYAGSGEYFATFNMYRIIAGIDSLIYQNTGQFSPPYDEIRMTCLTIHPDILVSYAFQGERSQTMGDFSDPTLVNVSQASSTSSMGTVLNPPEGYYRFRTILTYNIGTQASKTSDWSYITIGMGGGTQSIGFDELNDELTKSDEEWEL
jgi:hypothetical protein